jgi:hypothetical protein
MKEQEKIIKELLILIFDEKDIDVSIEQDIADKYLIVVSGLKALKKKEAIFNVRAILRILFLALEVRDLLPGMLKVKFE